MLFFLLFFKIYFEQEIQFEIYSVSRILLENKQVPELRRNILESSQECLNSSPLWLFFQQEDDPDKINA